MADKVAASVSKKVIRVKKLPKQTVKKVKTVQRKMKNTRVNLIFQNNPVPLNLVLQNIYLLNNPGTKYITLGYDPANHFYLTIMIVSTDGFVTMTVTDWLALMSTSNNIFEFFKSSELTVAENIISTLNIEVSKNLSDELRPIKLENSRQVRENKTILLTEAEFSRCVLLDSYYQTLIKQMQVNPPLLGDYYAYYVFYCQTFDKSKLDDNEYFAPFGTTATFDGFRFFKEIPIFCSEMLLSDLK